MLSSILLLVATMLPTTTNTVWSREDVCMSAQVGDSTWMVMDTGDTWLVPTSLLDLTPEGDLVLVTDGNSTLSSTYTDASGIQHTVTTDCRRFTDVAACAAAHAAAVAKMRVLFPPPHTP